MTMSERANESTNEGNKTVMDDVYDPVVCKCLSLIRTGILDAVNELRCCKKVRSAALSAHHDKSYCWEFLLPIMIYKMK